MNHLTVVPDPDWRDRANCQGTDPEQFYPETGGSVRDAKRVCSRCPVATECLEYALGRQEAYGVWGGKSAPERKQIRKTRRRAAAVQGAAA